MDPQATWSQLQAACRSHDWPVVQELADTLLTWLHRGGFPPVTGQGTAHDAEQQRSLAIRFCRSALQQCAAEGTQLCDCFCPQT